MNENRKEASGAGLAIGGSVGLFVGAVLGGPPGAVILGILGAAIGHDFEQTSIEQGPCSANSSVSSDPKLIAKKMYVTGRYISTPVVVRGTGAHRSQRVVVRNGVASAEDAEVKYR